MSDIKTKKPKLKLKPGDLSPTRYRETSDGLVWRKLTRDGPVTIPLANFGAKIITEVREDDGAEVRRLFEIEARFKERKERFWVTADRFNSMAWVTEHLGARAIIYPGSLTKDHLRVAIQELSGQIPQRTIYTHTGWEQVDGNWVYLHGGGAIGRDGTVPGIEVRLPEPLRQYCLPTPKGSDQGEAIRASLGFLSVAKPSITVPVLGAIFRSVLGGTDFSIHISGPTGAGKSAMAALAQQHFGGAMDARHLPGNWSSTSNALEAIAFSAKDALLVVDDFAPLGSSNDVLRLHREADRLLRAQGNSAGRQRMRADTSLRPPKPPRGLMLSTGEDIPHGHSLRARMFIVEMSPGDMNWNRLTKCQREAAAGLYAQTMAGFIRWVAQHHDEIQENRGQMFMKLRAKSTSGGRHRRTPEIVANLQIGVHMFLHFALDAGVITPDTAVRLWRSSWRILRQTAGAQIAHHAANDPARRFLDLLRAAIAAGRAHVANEDGSAPPKPAAWGWRMRDDVLKSPSPGGDLVGWLSGGDLYLEPEAAFGAAQRMAKDAGDPITVSSQTLRKRLKERGLLASVDKTRGTLTVRRMLGGAKRSVLHLTPDALGLSSK
jgi:hypothetical protein